MTPIKKFAPTYTHRFRCFPWSTMAFRENIRGIQSSVPGVIDFGPQRDHGSPEALAEARRLVDGIEADMTRARAIGFTIDSSSEGRRRGPALLALVSDIEDPMRAASVADQILDEVKRQPHAPPRCRRFKGALRALLGRRAHEYADANGIHDTN